MKKVLIILFIYLNTNVVLSQKAIYCGNEPIVIASGDIGNAFLKNCQKDLQITTLGENTEIKGVIEMNQNQSIFIVPKPNYIIRIKPMYIDSDPIKDPRTRSRTRLGGASKDDKSSENHDNTNDIQIKTSLNEEPIKKLTIYPNPVKENLTINTTSTIKSYRIINTLGNIYLEGYNLTDTTFSVATLPTGLYYISIQTENKIITKSFYKN